MKMEKTWLSYSLWLAFTAIAGMLSVEYLSTIIINLQESNKYMAPAFIGIAFILIVLIWFAGHKLAIAFGGRFLKGARSLKMLECFLVICLFASSVLYRIQILKYLEAPEGGIYYEMALIKSHEGVPMISHSASYCYTVVLSTILSFSGNKVMAGVFLQIALQILSLLLLYFGVKMLVGRVEAFCAMAVMAFLPSYVGQINCLDPKTFDFFLFTAGILLAGLCRRANEAEKRKKSAYALFIFNGIYIGTMGYLDAFGFTLLLFIGGICVKEAMEGEDGRKGGERRSEKCKSGGFKFFLCLLGACSASLGFAALEAALSGGSLENIWNAWRNVYSMEGSIGSFAGPDGNPIAGMVLCLCGVLGCVGFRFHERQKQDVWILYLLAATVWNMAVGGDFGYEIFISFGWSVLAGIGIASMGNGKEMEKTAKAAVPDIVLVDMDKTTAEEETEEKSGVKFIENPLPLPKKHIRREMDFDKIVEEEKMKFDIAVGDEDDFDI